MWDVLITSTRDVLKTSLGDDPWRIGNRDGIGRYGDRPEDITLGHSQDVIFQRPNDVGRGRPQDVGRRCPLALHRGPYGDVHRTSFGEILRTSSGHNFAELVVL